MNTNPKPRPFVMASNPTLADEIVDRVVAMRPTRRDVVETKIGPSEATYAQILTVDPDGAAEDLGEHPIFWTLVRRQLAKATPEAPWVVGRLVLDRQAYRLEPIGETEADLAQSSLAALQAAG